MRVGVPREVKNRESRVALTPEGARALTDRGHSVTVERGAGEGSGFADADYQAAGATLGAVEDAWGGELVLKVKEPVAHEYRWLRADLTLFTFLHLAANEPLAAALCESGCLAISYDTVQAADGSLPILRPMSEVAGRLAVVAGAYYMLGPQGGRGVLLSGMDGAEPARVTVIGAGVAGSNAVAQAVAMGARVRVLDLDDARLAVLAARHGDAVETLHSGADAIAAAVSDSELVVGAVLVPGRPAPKVVSHSMVEMARVGTVFVDIAIDQGGCFADSHATTHDDPVFAVAGTVFYCVANMPGAAARTSTLALTAVTLPFALELADHGGAAAVERDSALAAGLSTAGGEIRHPAAAEAFPHLPSAG